MNKKNRQQRKYTLGWIITVTPAIMMIILISGLFDPWVSGASAGGKEAETLVMVNNAHTKISLGKYNEAYLELSVAIKQDPTIAAPYSALGKLAMITAKDEMAEQYFLQALKKKNPDKTEIYKGLAEVYLRQDKIDQALICLRRALKIEEHSHALWRRVAEIETHKGQLDQAAKSIRRAINSHPTVGNLYTQMLDDVQRSPDGKKYDECVKLCLEHSSHNHLCEHYSKTSVDYFLQKNQACTIDYLLLSDILSRKGLSDSAIVIVELALEIWPNAPNLLNEAGKLYGKAGDYSCAETHLRHALEIAPNNRAIRQNLDKVMNAKAKSE